MNDKLRLIALLVFGCALASSQQSSASPWGEKYFPNTELITHDGEIVHFFDDLVEDKVVVINFIYTSCPDVCPLETAQLTRVQHILGDRLGKDVFFYSITIDPDVDTPEVLSEYRDRFGANWMFLTGDEAEIIELRQKLGLYVEEIQDGSNNHNVNMIIGNQSTGRWMKRSPFENPHVLADQIGNWLTDWRAPPKGDDYSNAPELRNIPTGERLFRTRCATCHTITGVQTADALGPDLLGVTERRELGWLVNWIRTPDKMLRKKDPIAMSLAAQFNYVPMPNMRLNEQEVMDIIVYIENESRWIANSRSHGDVIAVSNAWVKEAVPQATINAGYMTLVNSGPADVTLVGVDSETFQRVEIHEMATQNGLMKMRSIDELVIPANGRVELAPGGKHLMLHSAYKPPAAGTKIDLTLSFASGKTQVLHVAVK